MNIEPASFTQVRRARGGRLVHVDGEVARAVKEVDPDLDLRYSETGEYFVVYHTEHRPDGFRKERLVLTAQECDHRIPARCLLIGSGKYDYLAEVDALDAKFARDLEARRKEQVGEVGERLAHAIRRDMGWNTHKAFIKEKPDV